FFRRYYHPSNASLSIAGDVDAGTALTLARAYFGDLDPWPRADPVTAEAALGADDRIVIEDRVELPRLYLAWLTPAMFAPFDAELDLASDLLANGKTSRLYRRLAFDERIATAVPAGHDSRHT